MLPSTKNTHQIIQESLGKFSWFPQDLINEVKNYVHAFYQEFSSGDVPFGLTVIACKTTSLADQLAWRISQKYREYNIVVKRFPNATHKNVLDTMARKLRMKIRNKNMDRPHAIFIHHPSPEVLKSQSYKYLTGLFEKINLYLFLVTSDITDLVTNNSTYILRNMRDISMLNAIDNTARAFGLAVRTQNATSMLGMAVRAHKGCFYVHIRGENPEGYYMSEQSVVAEDWDKDDEV